MNTIILESNGVKKEYAPVDEISTNMPSLANKNGSAVQMVRTRSAGVFYGELVSRNGQEVILLNARRCWYWDGAASLSELAMEGVTKPEECKFPIAVMGETVLPEMIEMLPMTEKAVRSLNGVKIWRADK